MRQILTTITMMTIAVALYASDLARELQLRSLPTYTAREYVYSRNVGAMVYLDTLSLSSAFTGVENSVADVSVIPQYGNGYTRRHIGAKSYQNLDEESSVWGKAIFSTGEMRGIRWTDCIDYDIVGPYVSGDDTGGDITYRRYDFGGGYCKQYDAHWSLGAALDYRAEIAWRATDPRIKDIVSDICLSIGAAYKHDDRIIGISSKFMSYTQNSELEFYNPINDINTLPLTGLGTYYKRFAGNTNKNTGHSGIGIEACLQSLTTDDEGLQLSASFRSMRISEALRNFNNITLAYTDTYQPELDIIYGITTSNTLRLQPSFKVMYERRLGTENLFGTAAGASYDKIGSRNPYLRKISTMAFVLPIELRLGKIFMTFTPNLRYTRYHESMTLPERSLMWESITPTFDMNYSMLIGRDWLIGVSGGFSYKNILKKDMIFDDYDKESGLQQSVVDSYMFLSSATTAYCLDVKVAHNLGSMMAAMKIGTNNSHIRSHINEHNYHVTLSLTF